MCDLEFGRSLNCGPVARRQQLSLQPCSLGRTVTAKVMASCLTLPYPQDGSNKQHETITLSVKRHISIEEE